VRSESAPRPVVLLLSGQSETVSGGLIKGGKDVGNLIKFKLFGELCVFSEADQTWKTLDSVTEKTVGKKAAGFLTYFLLNHDRKISSAELIERFWPGEGKDPVNSLKNMIHKTRSVLHDAFPEQGELILTQSGGYEWNRDVAIELDVELFEQLYQRAKMGATSDHVDLEMEAFGLYTSAILPGGSEEWLDHINIYYRTVYIDICKSLAMHLQENEAWSDVIHVCKQAYTLAPEEETFTIGMMQALTATGFHKQAIEQYEIYRDMLWREFNLVPSERTERVYTLAVESGKGNGVYEDEFVRQLTQYTEQTSAFHCSLLVFRNVVQLELRHMARSSQPAAIAIVRAEAPEGEAPSATDIRRLERTLLHSLRAGDPFTRLNQGSFAILLSTATLENAQKVMERVKNSFHSNYPRSRAVLRCRVYPLNTEQND